jgi:hypothetical protein
MQTQPDRKYSEALALEIAAVLARRTHGIATVSVRFDEAAQTHAVRIEFGEHRYDLTMPAPGAHYALFRNETWLGGMNLTTDADPERVASTLLARIADTT